MSKAPVARFRIGFITANVWENLNATNHVYFTVDLTRTWKEGDEYKQTATLMSGDLLNAAMVLRRAEKYIAASS